MPIDTADKRRSAAGTPALPLGPGVTPDATPGVEWRQQSGWGYSGITPAAPGGGTAMLLLVATNRFGNRQVLQGGRR